MLPKYLLCVIVLKFPHREYLQTLWLTIFFSFYRLFRDVIELPYRWLLIVRKSNFAPLAPGTKPLPAHLARKPDARKELESAVPVAGNPFGDGPSPYQWAEFETVDVTKHVSAPPPLHVDLNKGEQIWYYMGQSSTECRAQYTHNPSVSVHNPRSNFLDSVKSLGGVVTRLPSYPHHFPQYASI